MKKEKYEHEKVIKDFSDREVGDIQIWIGKVKVDNQIIEYKRYTYITDKDTDGNNYLTDDIEIITKLNDSYLIEDITDWLLN